MADDAPRPVGPRVVVRISDEMQFLLTQVARHLVCQKKELHDQIWRAGVKEVLGITPEKVEQSRVTSLPRSTAATDAKSLVKLIMANS